MDGCNEEEKPPSKVCIGKNTLSIIDGRNKSSMSTGRIITIRKQQLGRLSSYSWLSMLIDV